MNSSAFLVYCYLSFALELDKFRSKRLPFLLAILILSFSNLFKNVSKNLYKSDNLTYLFFIGLTAFILGGFAYWILGPTQLLTAGILGTSYCFLLEHQ